MNIKNNIDSANVFTSLRYSVKPVVLQKAIDYNSQNRLSLSLKSNASIIKTHSLRADS